MQEHITASDLIPDVQFGFGRGHSNTHQVRRVVNDIRDGLNRGESTGLLLLDLTCAFDTAWHAAPLHQMYQNQFPIYLVKVIRSYLTDRTFCVRVNKTTSSLRTIPAGVPQGSTLSPDLSNIFTYDIPRGTGFNVGAFADDSAIWYTAKRAASVRKSVQAGSNSYTKYYRSWRLKQNPSKVEAVYFTRRRAERAFPRAGIKINSQTSDNRLFLEPVLV